MNFGVKITFVLFLTTLATACGKLQSKVITADMLKVGSPDLYETTFPLSDTTVSTNQTEDYPIVNAGYRAGRITRITYIDDTSHTTSNEFSTDAATTECDVGVVIEAGSSCNLSIQFSPGAAPQTYNATLKIEYENSDGEVYTSEFPLVGSGV